MKLKPLGGKINQVFNPDDEKKYFHKISKINNSNENSNSKINSNAATIYDINKGYHLFEIPPQEYTGDLIEEGQFMKIEVTPRFPRRIPCDESPPAVVIAPIRRRLPSVA